MEIVNGSFDSNYPRKRVLVVEDDESLRPVIRRMLKRLNPNTIVDWVRSAGDARDLLKHASGAKSFDLILSDVFLEGSETGLELVEDCRKRGIRADVVITSGGPIVRLEGDDYPYLRKPFTTASFNACLTPYILGPSAVARRPTEWRQWAISLLVLALLALLWAVTPRERLAARDTGADSMLYRFASIEENDRKV